MVNILENNENPNKQLLESKQFKYFELNQVSDHHPYYVKVKLK